MQAWLFVDNPTFWQDDQIKYYLSGVPDDALILLDLTSEETPIWNKIAANNKPFIWCMLHNYGETLTHSLTYSLTYSLTHLLTRSLTHSLNYSLTHLLTHSLTYLLTHLKVVLARFMGI